MHLCKIENPQHARLICEWMWLLIEKQENASVFAVSFKTLDFEDTLRKLASQKTPSIAHPLGHPSSQTAGSGAWNPLPEPPKCGVTLALCTLIEHVSRICPTSKWHTKSHHTLCVCLSNMVFNAFSPQQLSQTPPFSRRPKFGPSFWEIILAPAQPVHHV